MLYEIINPETEAVLGVVCAINKVRPFCREICHNDPTPETHVWVINKQTRKIVFRFIGLTTKNGHRRMAHLENLWKSPPTCHHSDVYRHLMKKDTIGGVKYEVEEHGTDN
jgi:hypothetical protein